MTQRTTKKKIFVLRDIRYKLSRGVRLYASQNMKKKQDHELASIIQRAVLANTSESEIARDNDLEATLDKLRSYVKEGGRQRAREMLINALNMHLKHGANSIFKEGYRAYAELSARYRQAFGNAMSRGIDYDAEADDDASNFEIDVFPNVILTYKYVETSSFFNYVTGPLSGFYLDKRRPKKNVTTPTDDIESVTPQLESVKSPEQVVIQQEDTYAFYLLVAEALSVLTSDQKEVWVRKILYKKTHTEIAEEIKKLKNAAASRQIFCRANQELAKHRPQLREFFEQLVERGKAKKNGKQDDKNHG